MSEIYNMFFKTFNYYYIIYYFVKREFANCISDIISPKYLIKYKNIIMIFWKFKFLNYIIFYYNINIFFLFFLYYIKYL